MLRPKALFFLLVSFSWVGQAQPSSQPVPSQETSASIAPKKSYAPLWSAGGYVLTNAGLLWGLHSLHAAKEQEEHALLDAALSDALLVSGLVSMGVGYIGHQKALHAPLLAPRLFFRAAALSGVASVLTFSLANAFSKDAQQEAYLTAQQLGYLSLSLSVGSLFTAFGLRP